MAYIEKRIYAGRYLEIIQYPERPKPSAARRGDRGNVTREVQEALNNRNAIKQLTWYMNANFTSQDTFVTLTHKDPDITEADAKKDITKFIRRANHYCKKHGRPDFKYIYITETTDLEVGIHHHMVCNSLSADEINTLWGNGITESRHLRFKGNGLERLARYFMKEQTAAVKDKTKCKKPRGWSRSQNLVKPRIVRRRLKDIRNPERPPNWKHYNVLAMSVTSDFYMGVYRHIQLEIKPQSESSKHKEDIYEQTQ